MTTFCAMQSNLMTIPNRPGVYVWGILEPTLAEIQAIKLEVRDRLEEFKATGRLNDLSIPKDITNTAIKDAHRLFLPLNVGETKDHSLSIRINRHYSREAFEMTVLFDLALNKIDLYNGIKAYNDNWIFQPRKTRQENNYPTLHANVNVNLGVNSLLFFANPSFMRQVFGENIILPPPPYLNQKNVKQDDIIKIVLPLNITNILVVDHIQRMLVARIILKKYFRFTYNIKPIPVNQLKEYEVATKVALERMGLFTIADAHSAIGSILRNGGNHLNDTIDFQTNLFGQIYNPLNLPQLIFNV